MRNEHVGNLYDFYKFGFLRHLIGVTQHSQPRIRLGVIWYQNLHGRVASSAAGTLYLQSESAEQYRSLDPLLYEALRAIVLNKRMLSAVEESKILPRATLFFPEPISLADKERGVLMGRRRIAHRDAWLERALHAMDRAELVFVDPDTGLEVPSTRRSWKSGARYSYYKELLPFWQRGQSLVIYQHNARRGKVVDQGKGRVRALQRMLGGGVSIRAVRFGKLTFLVAAQPAHADALLKRVTTFIDLWKDHVTAA